MSLPKNITVQDPVYARTYGLAYTRADGGPGIYADMHAGWTPEELEAVAVDIRERLAKRKKS